MGEIVELLDVPAFRRYKRAGSGVIVMKRGGSASSIHHPDCPFVTEDGFSERRENSGRAGYFWAESLEAARAEWPLARTCGHPMDPLAGGTGGNEVIRSGMQASTPSAGTTWELAGPTREMRAVRAFADSHIPFEPRTDDLVGFRSALRQRVSRLTAREDEMLHATYFGPKPANADVENLLLYNVDQGGGTFVAARAGVRFEYSRASPSSATRPVTYLYRPRKRTDGFALWRSEETIAEWDDVELDGPPGRIATLWLALRTGRVRLGSNAAGAPVAVRASLTPPDGTVAAITPLVVKTVIDAVVSALQAHNDPATLDAVSDRLAVAAGVDANTVANLLSDGGHAVLGPRKLVHLRGDGVIFAPTDEMVVAGEVIVLPSAGDSWRLAATVERVAPKRS